MEGRVTRDHCIVGKDFEQLFLVTVLKRFGSGKIIESVHATT
jgi:hypothetical protein